MAEHQLTCAGCGVQFVFHRRKKYCHPECRPKPVDKRQGKGPARWPDGIPDCHKPRICQWCDKVFRPKRAGRNTCCSRECGLKWVRAKTTLLKTGGRVYVRTRRFKAKPPPPGPRCHGCGCEYQRTEKYQRHCTDECKAQHRDRIKAEYRKSPSAKAAKKRRRAIERGARGGEAVSPDAVFDRDGWRCQHCGARTPKGRRGSCHPRAPELDRILPISQGGEHSYRNTQCLCRSCNAAKSDGPGGQLRLFG